MSLHTLNKTVTVAGTPERISATSIPCCEVTFQAKRGNTDHVAIGDSTVDESLVIGHDLLAGDGMRFGPYETNILNLMNIWVDAAVNGEGVTCNYIVR